MKKQSGNPLSWLMLIPIVFWGLVAVGTIVLALVFFTGGRPSPEQTANSENAKRYAGAEYNTERQALCNHFLLNPDVVSATHEEEADNVLVTLKLRRDYDDDHVQKLANRIQRYLSVGYSGERSSIVGEVAIDDPSGFVHRAYVMTGAHDTYNSDNNPTLPAVHDTSWTVRMGALPIGKP